MKQIKLELEQSRKQAQGKQFTSDIDTLKKDVMTSDIEMVS